MDDQEIAKLTAFHGRFAAAIESTSQMPISGGSFTVLEGAISMKCMSIPISITYHPIEEADHTGLKYIFFKGYESGQPIILELFLGPNGLCTDSLNGTDFAALDDSALARKIIFAVSDRLASGK
jgi:hypothetical protein